ncbi:MAG: transposase [Firmicutes bacterium]|nr:transposase [Bacillota bacterium]
MADQGVHVHSSDEMTGIPAHEHTHPVYPMIWGQEERREFEYIRQGTSGLIASRDVVTGQIEAPFIQPTRPGVDFANHIGAVVPWHPQDRHIFVLDNLNSHQSEELVRLVIAHVHRNISVKELGKKGKAGILWTQKPVMTFCKIPPTPSVRFLYNPKQTLGQTLPMDIQRLSAQTHREKT